MATRNIQLEAIIEAVNKLAALKAQTTRTTAFANAKQCANDYDYMASIAGKVKSIVDTLLLDTVYACFEALGHDLPAGVEEALTSDDAIDDAFAYAEDIAEEYRFGGAA